MCNICQQHDCNCNTLCSSCPPEICTCPVQLTSDCVTLKLSEPLSCSGIEDGVILTEVIQQLDQYICDAILDITSPLNLINIGTGAEIYKGIDGLGKRELKSIKSDGSVTIVENTDDITLSVDTSETSVIAGNNITITGNGSNITPYIINGLLPPLELKNEGNGDGIIIRGRNSNNYGTIGNGAIDLSVNVSTSSIMGATGNYSFTANRSNISSGHSSASLGTDNISSGQSSFTAGDGNISSGVSAISFGTLNQSTQDATTSLGYSNISSGLFSFSAGAGLFSRSYSEISVGAYCTDYSPSGIINFNTLDRAFNIGNGATAFGRSDAFTVLKNGLATLPSVTNSLITAASGKAVVTKEYVESLTFIDPTALHQINNEVFSGTKFCTNSGSTQNNGLKLTNTGIFGSYVLGIDNTGVGYGAYFNNQSSGDSMHIDNSGSGNAFVASSNGEGLNFVGQNDGINTYIVDKLGNITGNSFIKTGGLSTQFLKADGSVSIIDGSETKVTNGLTTIVSGNGTVATPFSIEVSNLQKVISTSYTLTDADNNYTIFVNNASTPITITVDSGITISNFCAGFIQEGTADITFAVSGVTLLNPVGLKSKGQNYQTFIERKLNTSSYFLLGNTKV